jgi:hypothetical protein
VFIPVTAKIDLRNVRILKRDASANADVVVGARDELQNRGQFS